MKLSDKVFKTLNETTTNDENGKTLKLGDIVKFSDKAREILKNDNGTNENNGKAVKHIYDFGKIIKLEQGNGEYVKLSVDFGLEEEGNVVQVTGNLLVKQYE